MKNKKILTYIHAIDYKLDELLEQREYISYYQDKFPSDAINNINNDYRYYKKLRSILVNMILDDEFLDKFDMLCQDNDDAQTPDVIKMYKKSNKKRNKYYFED